MLCDVVLCCVILMQCNAMPVCLYVCMSRYVDVYMSVCLYVCVCRIVLLKQLIRPDLTTGPTELSGTRTLVQAT